ncbi:uncharacterized protein LOC132628639 [Lycium barbarum]|uniref:uncharacterized protein LOC132628639 n=1 Tax=Lycium barbarum TaxID=112863 RepID=UPI00293E6369|nr:uncharacterized protein LOC132628639 [Lycium barbarum]
MSQLSETSQPNKPDKCFCGDDAVLRTSRTPKNPGRRFFTCAVGAQRNLKIAQDDLTQHNQDLYPSLKCSKGSAKLKKQRDHLIVQLRDTEIERDELKQKLMVAGEQRDQLLCASLGMLCLLFGNV